MNHQPPYPVSAHYPQPPGGHGEAPPTPPPRQSVGQSQAGVHFQNYGSSPIQGYTPPQPLPIPRDSYGAPARVLTYDAPQQKPQARQALMLGGTMLAVAALVISPRLNPTQEQGAQPFDCIKQEQQKAMVSRDQLRRLVNTELQTPKETVREFLQQPFCVLSPGQTAGGQPADREAYPLEFDPQTWLVVLYEGDRYVGYDFRFR